MSGVIQGSVRMSMGGIDYGLTGFLTTYSNCHIDGAVHGSDVLVHRQKALVCVDMSRERRIYVVFVEEVFHSLLHAEGL